MRDIGRRDSSISYGHWLFSLILSSVLEYWPINEGVRVYVSVGSRLRNARSVTNVQELFGLGSHDTCAVTSRLLIRRHYLVKIFFVTSLELKDVSSCSCEVWRSWLKWEPSCYKSTCYSAACFTGCFECSFICLYRCKLASIRLD